LDSALIISSLKIPRLILVPEDVDLIRDSELVKYSKDAQDQVVLTEVMEVEELQSQVSREWSKDAKIPSLSLTITEKRQDTKGQEGPVEIYRNQLEEQEEGSSGLQLHKL
jgi:hypothetical protein